MTKLPVVAGRLFVLQPSPFRPSTRECGGEINYRRLCHVVFPTQVGQNDKGASSRALVRHEQRTFWLNNCNFYQESTINARRAVTLGLSAKHCNKKGVTNVYVLYCTLHVPWKFLAVLQSSAGYHPHRHR